MNKERKIFERLYLRNDGTPRNSKPFEPLESEQDEKLLHITQHDLEELHTRSEAFKRTQKKFAIGVVAMVGAGVNVINPPSNVGELLLNCIPAVVVQSIGYMSFKNGIQIMRNTWFEKINN